MLQLLLILIALQQSYQPPDEAIFDFKFNCLEITTGLSSTVLTNYKHTEDDKGVKIDLMRAVRSAACRRATDVDCMFTCQNKI